MTVIHSIVFEAFSIYKVDFDTTNKITTTIDKLIYYKNRFYDVTAVDESKMQ
jgi:hypothetical protein